MQKIPQAVAMILLISALAAAPASAQIKHDKSGAMQGIAATKGTAAVESLLHEFLKNVEDPAMHDRFWADDVVYVGSTGKVRTKAEILANVKAEAAKAKPQVGGADSFDAEDVKIRQYGDVCVLNFRLVAHMGSETKYFRNSGVFVNHNGKWQAVSWQATAEAEQK